MGITNIFVLFQDAAGTCPPQRHRAVGARESKRPHLPFKHCTKRLLLMLVRCSASLLTPTAPSKSPASLKGKSGCFILKKNLPVLTQTSVVSSQCLAMHLHNFILHITHSNKRRKRCKIHCGISSLVLGLTALHTSSEVDSQAPAVTFPLFPPTSTLYHCSVCFCILGIPLRLLIYLEIILTTKTSTDSPHLAL